MVGSPTAQALKPLVWLARDLSGFRSS
jgi:hypothetical protein